MAHVLSSAARAGMHAVLVNYRGSGPLVVPRWEPPTVAADVRHVCAALRDRFPGLPLLGCGVSKARARARSWFSWGGDSYMINKK